MIVAVCAGLVFGLAVVLTVRELDHRRIGRHRREAWYLGFNSGRRVGPRPEEDE